MKKITLDEVAKLAFVSRSVVSRVLNNNPNVSDEARKRVKSIIKEYNYSPSYLARSLSANRTNEICIIGPRRVGSSLASGFWPILHAGIFEMCIERGYFINLTFMSHAIAHEIDDRILNDNRFDGYLLYTQEVTDIVYESLCKKDVPIALIGHNDFHPNIPSVDVDNYQGAYLATSYLCDLGHKKIGAILGNLKWKESYDRKTAFLNVLEENDLPINENWIIDTSYSELSGYESMKKLLSQDSHPTALICGSDSIAMGAIYYLIESNIPVPEKVSIIGFDDLPFTDYLNPPLTTIRQPIFEKGMYAANLIIDIIEGKPIEVLKKIMEPQLIVRKSCDAPPKY